MTEENKLLVDKCTTLEKSFNSNDLPSNNSQSFYQDSSDVVQTDYNYFDPFDD